MNNISGIEQERAKPAWRVSIQPVLCGFIGGTLAIGVLATLAKSSGLPLLIAPFGASCVLLFGAPDSPFAQPRNLVFGHLIASAIGLTVFALGDAGIWQMALAVGLAIAGMQLTRTVHPPAGADPLVIMLAGGASAQFLIVPVLAGVLCLLAIAWVFNNIARGKRWPSKR
jgi:CBS-domain-containing membrane protein